MLVCGQVLHQNAQTLLEELRSNIFLKMGVTYVACQTGEDCILYPHKDFPMLPQIW